MLSVSPLNQDAEGNMGQFYQDTPPNGAPTAMVLAGESSVEVTDLIYTGLSDINKVNDLTLSVIENNGSSARVKSNQQRTSHATAHSSNQIFRQEQGVGGQQSFEVRDIEIVMSSSSEQILVGGDEIGADASTTQTTLTATLTDIAGNPIPYIDLFVTTNLGKIQNNGSYLNPMGTVMTDTQGQIELVLISEQTPGEANVVVQTPGASQSQQSVLFITPPTKLTNYNAAGSTGDGQGDAEGNGRPTVQDYKDAGVTGVDESNIDGLNEIIAKLSQEQKDTLAEIQSVVNIYNKLLDTVDDPTSSLYLSVSEYQAIGLSDVDTPAEVNELNSRLSLASMAEIRPYSSLTDFVDSGLEYVLWLARPIPSLDRSGKLILLFILLLVGLYASHRSQLRWRG